MKKFTVITKDGSKWLSRTAPHGVDPIQWHSDNLALPYIGASEPGTSLSEEQVAPVAQYQTTEFGSLTWYTADDEDEINRWRERNPDGFKTRTAYTDVKSHDLYVFDEILNNTSDDAKMNVSLQMDLNYWKRRCEAAERFIAKSPCDPDITKTQNAAYEAWQEIVKQQPK